MMTTESLKVLVGRKRKRRLVGPESGWEGVCAPPGCSLCGGRNIVDVWFEEAGIRICRSAIDKFGNPVSGSARDSKNLRAGVVCCGHLEVLWGALPLPALELLHFRHTLSWQDYEFKRAMDPWEPKIHRWQSTGKTPCGRDVTKVLVNGGRPGDNGITCLSCRYTERRDNSWEINPGKYRKPGLSPAEARQLKTRQPVQLSQ